MQQTLRDNGTALLSVHNRYSGTDQSASTAFQVIQDERRQEEIGIDRTRAHEARNESEHGANRPRSAEELGDEAGHDAVEDDYEVSLDGD